MNLNLFEYEMKIRAAEIVAPYSSGFVQSTPAWHEPPSANESLIGMICESL